MHKLRMVKVRTQRIYYYRQEQKALPLSTFIEQGKYIFWQGDWLMDFIKQDRH